MSKENKEKSPQTINAELVEGRGNTKRVKLTFSDGSVGFISVISPQTHRRISDKELMALSVMRLIAPEVNFNEKTGVDQAGFSVENESGIEWLPRNRENNYQDALNWAGAILQSNGWSGDQVAKIMANEFLGQTLMVSNILGNEGGLLILNAQKARIRVAVLNHYPGVKSSFARRKNSQW